MIPLDYGVWLVTRAEWGAREPDSVTALQVGTDTNHWGGPGFGAPFPHDSCPAKVRAWQNFHMDHQGWTDIAYNAVACPHGYVFEGRGRGVRSAANGTTAGNSGSYATCYLGGEGDQFTEPAKRAMRASGNWLTYPGSLRRGHRDWKSTTCPGDVIYGWVRAGQPVTWGDPPPFPPSVPKLEDIMPFPVIGAPTDTADRPWTALLPGKIIRFANWEPLPEPTPDQEWLHGRFYEAGVDAGFLQAVQRVDTVDNYDEACFLAQRCVLPSPPP